MKIEDLLKGKDSCTCGRVHQCPIEHVVIGENACACLPEITEDFTHILLVADRNTYGVCGKMVQDFLADRLADTLIFEGDGVLVPDEVAIEALRSHVSAKTDLIVGVGAGVINDLCKHVSLACSLPYDIVATAPSMDGYASRGAALILGGMKVTLDAHVPRAIVADVNVLKNAPLDMIRAGYGDIIGKYSCLNDWRLSHLVNGEYFCPFVHDKTLDAVKKTVALSCGLIQRSPEAVGALMEALVSVGILMAYVGNSRPASGSEHHMSHYFEIVGILRGEPYLAHGIDVCCSAVETAKLREALLAFDIEDAVLCFDMSCYENEIRRIYGAIADEVLNLQEKAGTYKIDRLSIYRQKWQEICAVLADAPSAERMRELVGEIGISLSDFEALYGESKLADARLYAKDLKDRYTVLNMYYDLLS